MKFSILIANYNNGKFFKDCYESLLAQSFEDWEAIIVDDHSVDDSVDLIQKLIGNDNRFKIFFNEINKGCGYTKRKCAKLAQGEILGFLDPDDAIKSNALQLMVDAHEANPEAAIITSKYELVDLEMNSSRPGPNGEALPGGESYLTYGKGALTHFATFKKKIIIRLKV